MKSRTTPRPHLRSATKHPGPRDNAREHYHREKARRARGTSAESDAMAAARREYLALLESDAARGKGGRPKKKPAAPVEREDVEVEEDATEE
jgi:hypothetical protein